MRAKRKERGEPRARKLKKICTSPGMAAIKVKAKLGEGTYGRVFLSTYGEYGQVVVKEVKARSSDHGLLSVATLREVQALRELRHPHIVK